MDERALAERLITYDTSKPDGIRACAGFVKGWLEAREIDVHDGTFSELPVLMADIGPAGGPTLILHGHLDVVPGHAEQFSPRIEGDRLYGRGAYDMKGGLAAMMCAMRDLAEQRSVRVRFVCVPDEESEDIDTRSIDEIVRGGFPGDFAITGEPTDLHVGVQAKGVLAFRLNVYGRSAHGSTPWLGDNAVLKAIDVFRRIESLPFSRESSELFDRPSVNLGRIQGGDALNKVPDLCTMVVDIRYLPNGRGEEKVERGGRGQDPGEILEQIRSIPDIEVVKTFTRGPADVSRSNPYVIALVAAVGRLTSGESMSVGRDGASDAISFLQAGIPAVEFGPAGAGHHGPDEWVSISSLSQLPAGAVRLRGAAAGRARAAGRAARGGGRAGVSDDEAPPGRSRGLIWRGLLAGFLITLMTAGAVSAAGLLQVEDILDTLRAQGRAAIEMPELDRSEAGKAQTLMILGSDRRYGDREAGLKPRSDTIILVRLDPDKEVIAMTSIPRDLLVEIPGVGSSVKINEAYATSGERGAVRAVKRAAVGRRQAVPDQPRDHDRLRRLPQGDRLHRLRLRRHRPRLLQRPGRPRRLRGDRHRPRLPEAVRQGRARLRALPPHRQRPRARRAPAGLPAPGAQREGHAQAARGRLRARQPEEARARVRALLRPRQDARLEEGGLQVREDRPLHGRQPRARGALPRRPTRPTG